MVMVVWDINKQLRAQKDMIGWELILAWCADRAADGNKSSDGMGAQRDTHSGSDCGTAESLNHSLEDRVSC